MSRLTLSVVMLFAVCAFLRADSFDNYTNFHLSKLAESKSVEVGSPGTELEFAL